MDHDLDPIIGVLAGAGFGLLLFAVVFIAVFA